MQQSDDRDLAKRIAEETRLRQFLRASGVNINQVTLNGVSLNEILKTLPTHKITSLRESLEQSKPTADTVNQQLSEALKEQSGPKKESLVSQDNNQSRIQNLEQQLNDKIIEVTITIQQMVLNYALWQDTSPLFGGGDFKQITDSGIKSAGNVQAGISQMNAISTDILPPNDIKNYERLLSRYIQIAEDQTRSQVGAFLGFLSNKPDPKTNAFFNEVKNLKPFLAQLPSDDTKKIIVLEQRIKNLDAMKETLRNSIVPADQKPSGP